MIEKVNQIRAWYFLRIYKFSWTSNKRKGKLNIKKSIMFVWNGDKGKQTEIFDFYKLSKIVIVILPCFLIIRVHASLLNIKFLPGALYQKIAGTI